MGGALAATLLDFSRMAHLMEFMQSAPSTVRTRDQQNIRIQGTGMGKRLPPLPSEDNEDFWSRSPPRRGGSNVLLQLSPCNSTLDKSGQSTKAVRAKSPSRRGKAKLKKQSPCPRRQQQQHQQPKQVVRRKKKRQAVTFVFAGDNN